MKNWQIVLTTVLISLIAAPAIALETYWQGGTGNWSTGANWTNGEPGSDNYAYINNRLGADRSGRPAESM